MPNLPVLPKASLFLRSPIGLSFIVIVLIGLIFGVLSWDLGPLKNKPSEFEQQLNILSQQLESSGGDVSFTTPLINSLKKIPKEKDKKLQYKSLFNISAGVATLYSSSHNPNLRKFLESLGSFAQSNYPDNYQKSDFFVLCSDTECGVSSLPQEIAKIKKQIEENDLGPNKQAMINALNDVAFATDNGKTEAERNRKTLDYDLVLALLEEEAQKGNKVASELASSLEKFLDSNKIMPNIPGASGSSNTAR